MIPLFLISLLSFNISSFSAFAAPECCGGKKKATVVLLTPEAEKALKDFKDNSLFLTSRKYVITSSKCIGGSTVKNDSLRIDVTSLNQLVISTQGRDDYDAEAPTFFTNIYVSGKYDKDNKFTGDYSSSEFKHQELNYGRGDYRDNSSSNPGGQGTLTLEKLTTGNQGIQIKIKNEVVCTAE